MGQQYYKIPRLTDCQISSFITALSHEFGKFQLTITVADNRIGAINFPEQDSEIWTQTLSLKGELITEFHGSVQGVLIYYYRGGLGNNSHEKSPSLDDIAINIDNISPIKLKIAARFIELFRPIKFPLSNNPDTLFDEQRAIQESIFARLQSQLEQVFQQTIDIRAELDASIKQKEHELDLEYKEKIYLAEEQIEKERSKLIKEKTDLDARRKLIDDSDNTYARRQIREKMLQDVADRVQNFGVSNATIAARKPVAQSIVSLVVFLGVLFLWTAFDLSRVRSEQSSTIEAIAISKKNSTPEPVTASASSAETVPTQEDNRTSTSKDIESIANISRELIALWVRLSLITLGLVATIIYYTKWQNKWADQFSQTEQALKQFHLDI